MPVSSDSVGQQTRIFNHDIDARWTMAYAAGLNDPAACYMDTGIRQDVIAHPVFPVCVEWPVILDARNLAGADTMSAEEASRGVHASHDLHILKPIRAGDVLSTQATVIGVEKIKPGAAQYLRLDTFNQHDELVTQTYQLSISRGVDVIGNKTFIAEPPVWPNFSPAGEPKAFSIPIAEGAANIYTETAKIFNPIHSDRAYALESGLPDIILHGTATLALAISQIVHHFADGKPEKIKRLGGRFTAMVLMPSTLTLHIHAETASGLSYSVLTETGDPAISSGFVCW
jgi:acyl dehydratase